MVKRHIAAKPDPLELGAYTPREASHYLQVPYSTLRAWVLGQRYRRGDDDSESVFEPVIELADPKNKLLSFNNLIEIHVLAGIRNDFNIRLQKARKSLRYVERKLEVRRPLLRQDFFSDGLELMVKHGGLILDVGNEGQVVSKDAIAKYLKRIERDPKGIPIKLFPFTRDPALEDARRIVIDPKVAFGRPVILGTGVPTSNIHGRWRAGESVVELADDFNVDVSLIEEALRCEDFQRSAA